MAGRSVSGLVDEDSIWNLGEIPLVKNAGIRHSLCVEFTAFYTRFLELKFVLADKVCNVFGLGLQYLAALQESGDAMPGFAVLEANVAEPIENIDTLESHEQQLLYGNRRLEHHLEADMVEKESQEGLTCRAQRPSMTRKLSSQGQRRPCVCWRVGPQRRHKQCVAPLRIMPA